MERTLLRVSPATVMLVFRSSLFLVGVRMSTIDSAFCFILKYLPNILSDWSKSDQKVDVSKSIDDR
jgi:hypothetical protein